MTPANAPLSDEALIAIMNGGEAPIVGTLSLGEYMRIAGARIAELLAEIARLTQWTNDLQSGMYVNCVYCGHQYGPTDKVPSTMAQILKTHIESCTKHPMSALKGERDAALVALAEAKAEIEKLAERCDNLSADAVTEQKEVYARAERAEALAAANARDAERYQLLRKSWIVCEYGTKRGIWINLDVAAKALNDSGLAEAFDAAIDAARAKEWT
jgi:hypothetical protein